MTISKMWRGLQIIHGVLLASLVIYGGVAINILQQPRKDAGASLDPTLIVGILGGLSILVLLVVVPVIRAKGLPPRDWVGDGRSRDLEIELDETAQQMMKKLRITLLLTWAFCEAVAVWGLIGTILFHDIRYYLGFAAVAAAAMAYHAPRRSLLEACMRAANLG
jgi:hypothetical protein